MGSLNAGAVGRNRDSEPISGFITCCQRCDRLGVINTAPPDRGKLWHLLLVVSGGVCWWQETTTKCFWQEVSNVTPKATEQHLIVHSDKSVTYVTNNKRLRLTFCTAEANYWQTRSVARPLCESQATCIVLWSVCCHCGWFCVTCCTILYLSTVLPKPKNVNSRKFE